LLIAHHLNNISIGNGGMMLEYHGSANQCVYSKKWWTYPIFLYFNLL